MTDTVGNPHIEAVQDMQGDEGITTATIIAESNLAVTFELRTIAMILVAMYDAEHSTHPWSVDDELNWKKDIARRLR